MKTAKRAADVPLEKAETVDYSLVRKRQRRDAAVASEPARDIFQARIGHDVSNATHKKILAGLIALPLTTRGDGNGAVSFVTTAADVGAAPMALLRSRRVAVQTAGAAATEAAAATGAGAGPGASTAMTRKASRAAALRREECDSATAVVGAAVIDEPLSLELLLRASTGFSETRSGDGDATAATQLSSLQKQLSQLAGVDHDGSGRMRGSAVPLRLSGRGSGGALLSRQSASALARAERAEAYDAARRHISRWNELVQLNRRAPHLSFGAEATAVAGGEAAGAAASTSALAARFMPTTELEAAIAEALTASGVAALPATGTSVAERQQGDAAVLAAERSELAWKLAAAETQDGAFAANARRRALRAAGQGGATGFVAELAGAGVDVTKVVDPLAPAHADATAIRARAETLAKLRSMLFYEELKHRRQNKIKSKAYRALKGRADLRQGAAERGEMRELDPGAAAALDAEEARLLVRERVTLKHRTGKGVGGSKWLKRVLSRPGAGGGRNAATKADLVAHLRCSEDLQSRMRATRDEGCDGETGGSGSDGRSEHNSELHPALGEIDALSAAGASSDDIGEARFSADLFDGITSAAAVPKRAVLFVSGGSGELTAGVAAKGALETVNGLLGMRFMRSACERERALAVAADIAAADNLRANEDVLHRGEELGGINGDVGYDDVFWRGDGGEGDDSIGARRLQSLQNHSQQQVPHANGRQVFDGVGAAPRGVVESRSARSSAMENALASVGVGVLGVVTPTSCVLPLASAPLPVPHVAKTSTAANPWLGSAFSSDGTSGPVGAALSRHTAKIRATDHAASCSREAAAGALNVRTLVRLLDAAHAIAPTHEPLKPGNGASAALAAGKSQRGLIRRAFSLAVADDNDQLVAALATEKTTELSEGRGALSKVVTGRGGATGNIAPAKAGWGFWVGQGSSTAEEQAAREVRGSRNVHQGSALARAIVAESSGANNVIGPQAGGTIAATRADAHLRAVFLSEKRDRKLAAFQAGNVPHPFTSREQFERFLRQPAGPEWNTLAASSSMTMPQLLSRAGLIIKPIKYVDIRKTGMRTGESTATSTTGSAFNSWSTSL